MIRSVVTNEILNRLLAVERARALFGDVRVPVALSNRLRRSSKKNSSYASNRRCRMDRLTGLAVLVGLALTIGCSTAPSEPVPRDENGVALNRIPGVESIAIPAGLSDGQVLDAVELAIAGTRPGERNNAWVSQWRPELRDPANRWIRVGLSVRQHYLCVCYRIENGRLVPDVPTSTNLDQDGSSIHRKVPGWMNRLRSLIQMRLYGLANGTTCSGTGADGGRFCEKCGAKASASARYCADCGGRLTETGGPARK